MAPSGSRSSPNGPYNVSRDGMHVMPKELLKMEIQEIWVEFLGVSPKKKAKNHAVIRVLFARNYQDKVGVRIDMDVNADEDYDEEGDQASLYKPGMLLVKTIKYIEVSRSSNMSSQLKLIQDQNKSFRLKDLFTTLEKARLLEFDFVEIDERYYGCRDYV